MSLWVVELRLYDGVYPPVRTRRDGSTDGSLTMITLEVQLGRLLGYAVGSQLGYDAVQGAKVTGDTARDLAGRRC